MNRAYYIDPETGDTLDWDAGMELVERRITERRKKRRRAKSKVGSMVKSGKLPAAKSLLCACGKAATQYHHPNGYDPPHDIEVVAICNECHLSVHGTEYVDGRIVIKLKSQSS